MILARGSLWLKSKKVPMWLTESTTMTAWIRMVKKRELHFAKAVQVMNMKVAPDVSQKPRIVKYYFGCSGELLCRCKCIETERIQITKGFVFSVVDISFQVLMCLNGYGEVQTMDAEQKPMRFSKGETLFLSAGLGRCLVVGETELLKVRC